MNSDSLRTQQEYEKALSELQTLMLSDPAEGSNEDKRLGLLTLLIEDWEDRHVKLPTVSRQELDHFRQEQGLT